MKKIFTLILLNMIAFSAIHAEITWSLSNEGTLTISGTDMPDYYNATPWDSQQNNIKNVVIENGVTNIGACAFTYCSGISSITIPNSVTSIGEMAFGECSKLTSIIIPNSVTSIGACAFWACSSLTSITIPNSVTIIEEFTFEACSSLTSITIPNSVTSIERYAFTECSSLTSITIPNSVTSIEEHAFFDCPSLTSITIPNSVTYIGSYAFSYCPVESITIPNSVTYIGTSAFGHCSALKSIIVGNSVTTIENGAFSGCPSLTSISVRENNPKYDSRENCNAIIETESNTLVMGVNSTVIPNSVTSIGKNAFGGREITSITIPNSVTNIGDDAFYGCSGLTSVTIPNSVTSIGDSSFGECSGLTSVIIGNSVTSIGDWAFAGCSGLTSITIPNSVTNIGDRTFVRCENLTSITVGNSVTNIEGNAFLSCPLLHSVHITDLVSWCKIKFNNACANPLYYGGYLYLNDEEVNNLVIPQGINGIKDYSFYNCKSLTSLKVPYYVYSIGNEAFYGCSGLTSINCEATSSPLSTIPNCGNNSFEGVDKNIPLYVDASSIEAYKSSNGWQDFKKTGAIITDGYPYTNSSQYDEANIFYIRTFNNTAWQALYIPFSMSYDEWKNDFDVAYINGIRQIDTDNDNVIDETIMDVFKIEEGSLIPNTPYLIRAKKTGEKTIFVSDATLWQSEENSIDCSTTIAKYIFTGTRGYIDAETLIENGYYAMGGGSIIMTDGESDLKPLRWYLKVEARSPMYNVANAAKSITIRVKGEENGTTGIAEQNVVNDKSPIYDLNGRVVNKAALKAGMYIKNGKKIIIK